MIIYYSLIHVHSYRDTARLTIKTMLIKIKKTSKSGQTQVVPGNFQIFYLPL